VNPNIAKDLFNISFAMIWSQFNDNQKSTVIQNIEKTISNPNVPLTVLKTILDLAEFMEHDNQGLQLDITSMANLAEKCNAHAKALYYREYEFSFSPDESIESLISLYSNLGQPEAASGMLVFAKNILETKVKESWLESLGRWEEALEGYNLVNPTNSENLKDKIRCYDALAQWELVIEKAEEFISSNVESGEIAKYASSAAIQLGKWELLEKVTERINNRKDDINYYEAIINISKNKFSSAKLSIVKSRKYLENFLVGINKQTYHNNYDKLIRLQILSEMEEIIAFKEYQQASLSEQSMEGFSYEVMNSESDILKRKHELSELWIDRIEGVEKIMGYWLEIISIRTLLFKKSEMLPLMFRFAKWALKKGQPALCQRIFSDLEEEMSNMKLAECIFEKEGMQIAQRKGTRGRDEGFIIEYSANAKQFYLPPEFYLSKFEKMYQLKELNNDQIYACIEEFFQTVEVNSELKATYCRKLGSWLAESLSESSDEGFDKVLGLFKDSLKYNDKVVKTWHLFGLTNYKRILSYCSAEKAEEGQSIDEKMKGFIHDAFDGFIKSIALGGPEFTETLQDTLKLLELWFKYGDLPEIDLLLKASYEIIDISCWLNVIPQMITKLDINNEVVHKNMLELIEYVSSG
jgi:FKBP12-rapamycin complex-associated protein